MPKVLLTGSFNPFHNAHQYVYDTACKCFSKENVWLDINSNKNKPTKNAEAIKFSLVPITKNVITYTGLTADLVKREGFDLLVRGIRPGKSLEQEEEMLYWNRRLSGVETILIPTPPEVNQLSSSAIRELDSHGVSVLDCMNPNVYYRWKNEFPTTTIYFGRSCSGKSTYLTENDILNNNADRTIWEHLRPRVNGINIQNLKDGISEAFKNKDPEAFFQYIDDIGRAVDWKFFLKRWKVTDAAVIGSYWNYIPDKVKGSIKLIKIETSTANRIKFAKKRNVSNEFISSADYFYIDPPYWDETIEIKDIE
jgi:pantetheine-phosphate adenylyltransferase